MKELSYKKLTLSNKLTLITQSIYWKKSFSVYAYIGAGPRYETNKTAGLSHFLEHMLFEGTNKFSTSKKLALYIERVGGMSGAWTNREYVLYYAKVPGNYQLIALNYLFELLFNSTLKKIAINREKGIILEELGRKKDNPEIDIWDRWMKLVWGEDQWLGRSILGNETAIKNITRVQLLNYLKDLYIPENMVILITGNFKTDKIIKYFNNFKYFKKSKKTTSFIPKKLFLSQEKPQIKIIQSQVQQNQLILGFVTGVTHNHPDKFALMILASLLNRGINSRLFYRLVYDLGIAYNVSAGNWTFSDTGLFYVTGGFSLKNLKKALEVITEELNKLKRNKVDQKELIEAKIKQKSDLIFSLEDPEDLANYYAQQQIIEKRITPMSQTCKKIDLVTSEEVQKAACKYLQKKHLSLIIKGPVNPSFEALAREILVKF